MSGFKKTEFVKSKRVKPQIERPEITPFVPAAVDQDQPMTVKRLFQRINAMLNEDMVLVADVGDCLFGAADLEIYRHTEFVSSAYYTSLGFAIPAAIGAQTANRHLRPLVLVGDGAFQMTGLELSMANKLGYNPIVIVLNNRGYTTERYIQDGAFNDIPNWKYHQLPDLLGKGWGTQVHTEGELETALLNHHESFSLINVHLDPMDTISPALQRVGEKLSKRL